MINLFEFIGAVGLILISIGILIKKRLIQDIFYVVGGVCLEIYSIFIGNLIFIILQLIFTISAIVDLITIMKKD